MITESTVIKPLREGGRRGEGRGEEGKKEGEQVDSKPVDYLQSQIKALDSIGITH